MNRTFSSIIRPITAMPRFFFAVALAGCFPAIIFSVAEGVRIFRFISVATIESFTLAYLVSAILWLIKSSHLRIALKIIVLLPLLIWTLIEIGCLATTGSLITADSLDLILETDSQETADFFTQYFSLHALLMIIGVAACFKILIYFLTSILNKAITRRYGRATIAIGLIIMLMAGTYCSARILRGAFISDYQQFLIWEGEADSNNDLAKTFEIRYSPAPLKLPCLLNHARLVNGNFDHWLRLQQQTLDTPSTPADTAKFNLVLVIGESFIKAHSQLYGYYLPTNPRLKAESDSGRLITFSNVTTTDNFTTPALRNMMNLNDLSKGEQWYEGIYFPLVLKKAGYDVYHYDNQTIDITADRGLSRMFYSPLIREKVYSAISDSLFTYDGDFVDYISSRYAPLETKNPRLVIYHLKGQHFPASQRYPGRGKFTAEDITVKRPWLNAERRAEVAEYDNATLYNDSVVTLITSRFNTEPTLLFYFSDHGEDCWDLAPMEARNRQMPDDPAWVERQFSVPFFVWFSPALLEQDPRIAPRIQSIADRPLSLDRLGHLILSII